MLECDGRSPLCLDRGGGSERRAGQPRPGLRGGPRPDPEACACRASPSRCPGWCCDPLGTLAGASGPRRPVTHERSGRHGTRPAAPCAPAWLLSLLGVRLREPSGPARVCPRVVFRGPGDVSARSVLGVRRAEGREPVGGGAPSLWVDFQRGTFFLSLWVTPCLGTSLSSPVR